jgi:hypothetical protein
LGINLKVDTLIVRNLKEGNLIVRNLREDNLKEDTLREVAPRQDNLKEVNLRELILDSPNSETVEAENQGFIVVPINNLNVNPVSYTLFEIL